MSITRLVVYIPKATLTYIIGENDIEYIGSNRYYSEFSVHFKDDRVLWYRASEIISFSRGNTNKKGT